VITKETVETVTETVIETVIETVEHKADSEASVDNSSNKSSAIEDDSNDVAKNEVEESQPEKSAIEQQNDSGQITTDPDGNAAGDNENVHKATEEADEDSKQDNDIDKGRLFCFIFVVIFCCGSKLVKEICM